MTARSIAQRYLRSSVSMETQRVQKQRWGQRAHPIKRMIPEN
jgi:hypothetical protein